jgi:hypothetical protein
MLQNGVTFRIPLLRIGAVGVLVPAEGRVPLNSQSRVFGAGARRHAGGCL